MIKIMQYLNRSKMTFKTITKQKKKGRQKAQKKR